MGDTQFHFRIRQCSSRKMHHATYTDYNRGCPTALQVRCMLSRCMLNCYHILL